MSAHAIRQVNSTTPATKAIRFIDSSRSERVFRFVVQLFFVKGNVSLCRRVGPVNYSASPLLWLQPGWGWGSRTIFHFKDGSFSEETVGGIYFPWLRKKLSPTILQA